MPSSAPRRRGERVLAVVLVAQLFAGVISVVLLQPSPHRSPLSSKQALARAANVRTDARTVAVRRLLAARGAAVLRRDRSAFLATVDPSGKGFRVRQAHLIDALRDVPVGSWRYELDASAQRSHTLALDALRGTWWAPDVTLHYALAGFDREPTSQQQGLTFVKRGTRWYVGADDDFATSGTPTVRDIWDGGPVLVLRGTSCLVLGHPGNAALAKSLVGECDAAVPRVTAVWGRAWAQRVVVLLPDSPAELTRMLPRAGDVRHIAAVATARDDPLAPGDHPVEDRVVVNLAVIGRFSNLGRRVVMTHEVTHVASRAANGPGVPTWFVEGLAEYVGYQGVAIPLAVSAQELAVDVRAGKIPSALPSDVAFTGGADQSQIYEQSWLAVELLVRTYGQNAMLRLYRHAGADSHDGALARAMSRDLRTTLPAFTRTWQADLKRRLT